MYPPIHKKTDMSWSDLAYRHATKGFIEDAGYIPANSYVDSFVDQFAELDTDRKACFLFPESYVSQFFVITEICKKAEYFKPVRNLFPDEEKIHYLAVFDKQNMDDVLLMYHLLYTSTAQDLFGGYSLYDYPLIWYQTHLWQDGVVLRSPYLPDRLARYQGIQHYHPVSFFGGEEALAQRQELDRRKRQLCEENEVRLVEWPYSCEPAKENVEKILSHCK